MNKKNVVLILLIFIVMSILIIAFFGVNPVLPTNTVINKVSVYASNNEEIPYDVDESKVELGTYSTGYSYYFYIIINTDREIDLNNIDFNYDIYISNYDTTSFTLEAKSNSDFGVDEVKYVIDNNGVITSYNYYLYYSATFNVNKKLPITITLSRNSKSIYERKLSIYFTHEDTGSTDIDI